VSTMVKRSKKSARNRSEAAPLGGHFRLVTAATSISRVTGYVRDTLNAALFGAGWISDAYFMAIRIPSLLRDLFAEGALSNAFVPVFTARLKGKDPQPVWELMSQVFVRLLLVTGALTVLGILFAPFVVDVIAHGFSGTPDKFQLTVELTRILFPVLIFVSMAALWMGALNSMNRFTAPAFAPVFMNLTQIVVGILLLKFWKSSDPMEDIRNMRLWAAAMTLGMLFQWLAQVPAGWKAGIRIRRVWPKPNKDVREILALMGPSVVSQSVLQVNLLVNQFFASFLAAGYVSYLYYGNRMMQLPFGILAVSIATVTFPLLSRQTVAGKEKHFSQTLTQALSAGLFLMVPCTVGIWIVAEPACRLAFQYGAFTPEAAHAAAQATALYALGLVGYTGVKILLPAYYAKRKARQALNASMVAMVVNAGLNLTAFLYVTDPDIRFWGLALASGLGAMVNLGLLLVGLPDIGVHLSWRFLVAEKIKILLGTACMGLGAWGTLRGLQGLVLPLDRLFHFALPVAVGALIYLVTARMMSMAGWEWVRGARKAGKS
jgi:putative peptidoglycan lipid II flippase